MVVVTFFTLAVIAFIIAQISPDTLDRFLNQTVRKIPKVI